MRIAFDKHLGRGLKAYDDVLGHWWYCQSSDAAHGLAYRRIADYVAESFQGLSGLIVDYTCGAGNLLYHLAPRFPHSRFLGLDGSSYLLTVARRRLARLGKADSARVSLVKAVLPKHGLRIRASLLLFTFPNMVPGSPAAPCTLAESLLVKEDLEAAEALASLVRSGRESETNAYWGMLQARLISMNLRRLLCRGGYCVRAEYAGLRRDQMTRAELMRAVFEEGSQDVAIAGSARNTWFRVLASVYCRSGVIEDFHHQTKDAREPRGGYQITVLRAV